MNTLIKSDKYNGHFNFINEPEDLCVYVRWEPKIGSSRVLTSINKRVYLDNTEAVQKETIEAADKWIKEIMTNEVVRQDVKHLIYMNAIEAEEKMESYFEEYRKWRDKWESDWNIKRDNKLNEEI